MPACGVERSPLHYRAIVVFRHVDRNLNAASVGAPQQVPERFAHVRALENDPVPGCFDHVGHRVQHPLVAAPVPDDEFIAVDHLGDRLIAPLPGVFEIIAEKRGNVGAVNSHHEVVPREIVISEIYSPEVGDAVVDDNQFLVVAHYEVMVSAPPDRP